MTGLPAHPFTRLPAYPLIGYSGTPLAKKLGIKPGMKLLVVGEVPDEYPGWLAPLPERAAISGKGKPPFQAVHVFVTKRAELAKQLDRLRKTLEPDGFVWISWPKRASKVPTNITEDVIREVALPLGFVDIKVCAVSEVWSGLKLVIRVSERQKTRYGVPMG
ncbi:MAG TPA: DUF3052 domain-containing protein [Gemmatimonadaceae bacterium]